LFPIWHLFIFAGHYLLSFDLPGCVIKISNRTIFFADFCGVVKKNAREKKWLLPESVLFFENRQKRGFDTRPGPEMFFQLARPGRNPKEANHENKNHMRGTDACGRYGFTGIRRSGHADGFLQA
jgi:hypothetical protein